MYKLFYEVVSSNGNVRKDEIMHSEDKMVVAQEGARYVRNKIGDTQHSEQDLIIQLMLNNVVHANFGDNTVVICED